MDAPEQATGAGTSPATSPATKETQEDYTLRFAPPSYRRWSTGVVAISALGGIASLTDFAIGANIGMCVVRRTADLPMDEEHSNPSGETMTCHVCGQDYERPDLAACQEHDAHICSLSLSTDPTGAVCYPCSPSLP